MESMAVMETPLAWVSTSARVVSGQAPMAGRVTQMMWLAVPA